MHDAGLLPHPWMQCCRRLDGLELVDTEGREKLKGTVPLPEDLPEALDRFDLSYNELQGSLAGDWSLLSSLQFLYIEDNKLEGSLPTRWPGSLQILVMQGNLLAGGLAAASLPNSMEILGLSSNLLTGSVGILPSNLTSLKLDDNLFSGPLPALTENLADVFLSNNSFTGSLPQQLPTRLQYLDLADNKLSGTIPSTWILPGGMQLIWLWNNSLSGEQSYTLPCTDDAYTASNLMLWWQPDNQQLVQSGA